MALLVALVISVIVCVCVSRNAFETGFKVD